MFWKRNEKNLVFVGKFWERDEEGFHLKPFSVNAKNEDEAITLVKSLENYFCVFYIKEKR